MKRIDDKDIINLIKNNENYEIKTTSEDILKSFELEKKTLVTPQKKINKKKIFIGSSFGTLFLSGAVALAAVVIINNGKSKNPLKEEIFSPITNNDLKKQLVTFSSFTNPTSNSYRDNLIFKDILKIKDRDLNSENELTEENFTQIVNVYEKIQNGVNEVFNFNEITVTTREIEYKFNDKTYDYVDEFIDANDIVIASLYHNEVKISNDDEETTMSFEGLYVFNNTHFEAKFVEEKEIEEDEKEIEVTAIFNNLDDDSYTYVVNKESEFESHLSENSYSYSIYENYESYINNDDEYIEKVAYELDDEKLELSYEDRINEIECEFNNIKKRNNGFTFEVEYESNDFEGTYDVEVIYNSDGTRTYSSNGIDIDV